MSQQASGMAASIRGSTESDTFDLGGQNMTTIGNTIKSAFQDPLPISEMIRITFVTGAGKLGRQKYDEGAAKAVTAALRELSFEEDRGASCVRECAGSFKMQHDTGKNLKTVVVFPHIADEASGEGADGAGGTGSAARAKSILPKNSPEEMIALSSMNVFKNMVKSRCTSWSQKRGAVAALSEIKSIIDSFDEKLLKGTPLADDEQELYDTATSLDDKQAHVRELMHKQVDAGNLTGQEKAMLLTQVSEKLEAATKAPQKEKLQARKTKLASITPKQPHKLKHEAEILQLNLEMRPLLALEESTKGRLLSIKETQTLARKDEIMDEIRELEEKSRGWFEDDESFQSRVDACRAVCASRNNTAAKKKKAAAVKKGPVKSALPAGSGWATATASRPRARATKATPAAKKTGNNRGGGVFAAMMMDSDSD